MVALPLGKLLYIGIKQLSKPVAAQIKKGAVRSYFFRRYVCIPPAQVLHRLEVFVKMQVVGATGPTHVKPLKEDKAIEVGAEILGSTQKEATLEAEQDQDIDILKKKMNEMDQILNKIHVRLTKLEVSDAEHKPN